MCSLLNDLPRVSLDDFSSYSWALADSQGRSPPRQGSRRLRSEVQG
jgi:hypothetical protein